MAAHQPTVRILKSIAGAVLAGLGMFILYANTAGAVAHLRQILVSGSAALGGLPAAILVLVQTAYAYAALHQQSVHGFFQQALVSSLWPLVLVIFGTALSRDTFTENSGHLEKNNDKAVEVARPGAQHR
ncbi:MAG: hypothetical protein WB711_01115 [Terriglobales bacterium]